MTLTLSLFDEIPHPTPALRIEQNGTGPLSKDQKAFNTLIKKIEGARAKLIEWETAVPTFRQKCAAELFPLQKQCVDLQWEFAQALDTAHGQKGITQAEKRKLAGIIVDLTEVVLQHRDDADIKELFNRHSQSDFDAEEAARLDEMKAMFEHALGLDLGDDVDMRSPDEILKRVEDQFRAQLDEQQEQQDRRKKSSREQARAAKLEAEEKQLSQSIREVFRKLASALHPDREPDPAERARKTALMQRANEAYEKGNLLQLLELQLELEHIDQTHLAAIRPDRLKHYLKILKEQLRELELETQLVADRFGAEFGLPPFERVEPRDLMPILQQDMATCRAHLAELTDNLNTASDQKQLKAWLKTISSRGKRDQEFDIPF